MAGFTGHAVFDHFLECRRQVPVRAPVGMARQASLGVVDQILDMLWRSALVLAGVGHLQAVRHGGPACLHQQRKCIGVFVLPMKNQFVLFLIVIRSEKRLRFLVGNKVSDVVLQWRPVTAPALLVAQVNRLRVRCHDRSRDRHSVTCAALLCNGRGRKQPGN